MRRALRVDRLIKAVNLSISVMRDSVLAHPEFEFLIPDPDLDTAIERRCIELSRTYDDCRALLALFEAKRDLEAAE